MTPERSTLDADHRMALVREWDELVEHVRGLDGFENFLRPPGLDRLLSAADGGPVVLINVSRWRCDAIAVRPGEVTIIELPRLTLDAVRDRTGAYLRAAALAGGADPPDEELDRELDDCLRWMWDTFAARILDALGFREPPADGQPWPRVWWCPTGPLALLPVHAAGRHDQPGQSVVDRVVSSYTPTLRALLDARAVVPAQRTASDGLLFVGVAGADGLPALPQVEREHRDLMTLLPPGRHTFLTGAGAGREAVLNGLGGHRWAHFSCHALQDLDDPSRSGLRLHDGLATVTDLSARQHRGELAYLSGCRTAVGGLHLPDEAITLAAALHYAGFRHVIATLWPVRDRLAARVSAAVYAALIRDGRLDAGGVAVVLHEAVRTLRARFPRAPSAWTPYAHTGP